MGYIVKVAFTDKNDKHHYAVGDRYPYRGFVKKERLEELSTDKNKRGVVLIEEDKSEKKVEKAAEKVVEKTETKAPEKAETKKKSAKK